MACTMPGFPDKFMPFMDEDRWGSAAAGVMKYTYGPIVRYFRHKHIANDKDKEPDWRHKGRTLTTGYNKRW
jgi:hydrogenase small subunit